MAKDLPDDVVIQVQQNHHARVHNFRLILSATRQLKEALDVGARSPNAAVRRKQTLAKRQVERIAGVQWGAGLEAEFVLGGLQQMQRTYQTLFVKERDPAVIYYKIQAIDRAMKEIIRIMGELATEEKSGA